MREFIPALNLNEQFYHEVVAPLIAARFPGLKYSAGLIGWGSEVVGFDDAVSTDHNWGLRFQIFLSDADYGRLARTLDRVLDDNLPPDFLGFPTSFPVEVNDDQRAANARTKARHNIEIDTIKGYFSRYLGCNPFGEIRAAEWLSFPEHKLLAVTAGRVFDDDSGDLTAVRRKLVYYPRDVWLYMLAAQWDAILEEQAFVGRAGDAGDELGSAVIASRQIERIMKLGFLMELNYAPYSKWLGTAFRSLRCSAKLLPVFEEIIRSRQWRARDRAMARAYSIAADIHNSLGITASLGTETDGYFERPYTVLADGGFPIEIRKQISSPEVLKLLRLGSVNQLVSSDNILNEPQNIKRLRTLYR